MAKRGQTKPGENQIYPDRDWSWVGGLSDDRLKGYDRQFGEMAKHHRKKKQESSDTHDRQQHRQFQRMFEDRRVHTRIEIQRRQTKFLLNHGYDSMTTNYVEDSSRWTERAFGNSGYGFSDTPPVVEVQGGYAKFVLHKGEDGDKQPVIVWPKSYVEEYQSNRNASSYRHEYGHYLDYTLAGEDISFRSAQADFTKAMNRDGDEMMKNSGAADAKVKSKLKGAYTRITNKVEKMNDSEREQFLSERFKRSGLEYEEVKAAVEKHSVFSGMEDKHTRYAQLAVALEKKDAQGFINVLEGVYPTGAGRSADAVIALRVEANNKGSVPVLSDLLGSATDNKVRGASGHSSEYYKKGEAVRQAESFADIVSLDGEGSAFFKTVLERFTPDMYRTYQGILDEHKHGPEQDGSTSVH